MIVSQYTPRPMPGFPAGIDCTRLQPDKVIIEEGGFAVEMTRAEVEGLVVGMNASRKCHEMRQGKQRLPFENRAPKPTDWRERQRLYRESLRTGIPLEPLPSLKLDGPTITWDEWKKDWSDEFIAIFEKACLEHCGALPERIHVDDVVDYPPHIQRLRKVVVKS